MLGLAPDRIAEIPSYLGRPMTTVTAPALWDGHAATRVADVICASTTRLDGEQESASVSK